MKNAYRVRNVCDRVSRRVDAVFQEEFYAVLELKKPAHAHLLHNVEALPQET
jgi:hypothetical protein